MGLNTVIRFSITFVVSIVILLGYVSLGALVFVALEREIEDANKKKGLLILENFAIKFNLTRENVTEFLAVFQKLKEFHVDDGANRNIWSFEGAFYFCTTAITTIGTGNITPNSIPGQWFCLVYVLLGIPVLSLFFGLTGYYLTQILRLFLLKIETIFKTRLNIFWKQILALILIWVAGWACLALYAVWMWSSMSQWTLGESVYYSFTTFTTIGFGDYTTYNGGTDEFPLLITSFIVLTLMLPVASLMFSITAEFFQTLLCPVFLKAGLVKRTELQRILAEDQLLYRYRKMRKEMNNYNTFVKINDEEEDFPATSISAAALEGSLRYFQWLGSNNGESSSREEEEEKGYQHVNYVKRGAKQRGTLDSGKDIIIYGSRTTSRERAGSF